MKTMIPSSKFVYMRTYSRWLDDKGRRELSWDETSDRYLNYMFGKFGDRVPKTVQALIREKVKNLDTVGSMRAAWAAGAALDEDNTAGYNCSFLPVIDLRALSEMFYILMCGTGVGFSIEHQFIDQMPTVAKWTGDGAGVYVVEDSRKGWADSLMAGLNSWFAGKDIEFDYSKVRPRGARLKTMGGRASGPDPLKKLHDFCRKTISRAQGRQLTSLELLDICNMIADVVVVGGVRRSSQISFSDLDDDQIRDAKNYAKAEKEGWAVPPHRAMSNNSTVFFTKPDSVTFMREWLALAESGAGERGIYNVSKLDTLNPRRSLVYWTLPDGTKWVTLRSNPCGEILLRMFQFCNLSEIVVRATDTFDDLVEKVKAAVWLGAMQASMTHFPYLRPEWKKNCEEERLLGVSLTGQMDNPSLMTPEKLAILKQFAIKTARKACKSLGINMSVAITTGKPSGTVSQLVDCASGAHPRYSPFYIRRYRISSNDPLYRMMVAQGIQFSPENGEGPERVEKERQEYVARGFSREEANILVPDWTPESVNTWVVSFPIKSPDGAITRDQVSAIDQLEWYLKVQKNWCEHNQSITVYVRDDEWMKVGDWVYNHFDDLVGVSFLPYDGGRYQQAPYEEITEEQYNKLAAAFPEIDYSQLSQFELDDNTTGAQALACTAGACEIN